HRHADRHRRQLDIEPATEKLREPRKSLVETGDELAQPQEKASPFLLDTLDFGLTRINLEQILQHGRILPSDLPPAPRNALSSPSAILTRPRARMPRTRSLGRTGAQGFDQ